MGTRHKVVFGGRNTYSRLGQQINVDPGIDFTKKTTEMIAEYVTIT